MMDPTHLLRLLKRISISFERDKDFYPATMADGRDMIDRIAGDELVHENSDS